MARSTRIRNTHFIKPVGRLLSLSSFIRSNVHLKPARSAYALFLAAALLMGSLQCLAQQEDQQQMRGLDEQVQEIKSDVLSIAAELSQLEEKLLYPSGTQVAVFVALSEGTRMRLDAVQVQIDGQLVIYSAKELEALHKGGVQRIYIGNVATGDHQLDVLVNSKLADGTDFTPKQRFTFRKGVKPKLVELTLSGPGSGKDPIALGEM
jgi:hypothetical protein